MRKNLIKTAVALLPLLGLACGYHFRQALPTPEADLAALKVVAVAPLANLTQTKDAGKIITELLNQVIVTRGKYSVIANDSVLKAIPKSTPGGIIDRTQAQKLGQSLKADAVIYGTVSEYWYQEERKYYPDREPAVGLNARLVDVKTGAVLGVVSLTKTGGNAFTYLFSDNAGQLHDIALQASEEVIGALLP